MLEINVSVYSTITKTLFTLLCLCCTFVSSSYFVDSYIQPKWYCFLFLTFVWGAVSVFKVRYQQNIGLDKLTLSIIIFGAFLLVRNVLGGNYLGMAIIIGWLVLYFLCQTITKSQSSFFSITIILFCFLQSLLGLIQFFGIVASKLRAPIVGSFDNPAGFAVCIAIGIPFCFEWIIRKNNFRILFFFAALIMAIALTISESRAGIVSVISIFAIILYFKIISLGKIKKATIFLCLLFLLFVVSAGLFFLKKDSAIGRLFIWKNTFAMIIDHPYTGSGQGSFHSRYMLYQAEFFKTKPANSYVLLADSVSHPFNEYLLILAEYGVLGFMLCISIGFILFYYHRPMDPHVLSIMLVLIFACFSYPFRYPFVWVVLAYCFARLSHKIPVLIQLKIVFISISKIGISAVLAFVLYVTGKDVCFEYKWKCVSDLSPEENAQDILSTYKQLHSSWNGNPLFLYNYAAELYYLKKYSESLNILHQCELFLDDYDVQMLIATDYYNLRCWTKVENHLKLASDMCPARFRPLFYLFSLYKETGKKEYAINLARQIAKKPVKIKSLEIENIKNEVQLYLRGAN